MSASKCPQCSTALEAGAVLCPKCDLILDTSFLGGDILDSELDSPPAAPPVDDESYVSMFAEETGFLTSPTSEMSRTVFPLDDHHAPSIYAMVEDASVVEQTGGLAPSALSDLERHVLALANGERPVARIRTLVANADAHVDALDVQGALISLAEKKLIRQAGVARQEGAAPPPASSPEGPTRALNFSEAPTQAFPPQDHPGPPLDIDIDSDARAAASAAGAPERPAFEVDDAPPDWLDGPTNLDLRGAGLDEDDLESSSEDSSVEMTASALVSAEAEEALPPKVETMVFETNDAFLAAPDDEEADPFPPSTDTIDKSELVRRALSAEADAIFASTPQSGPNDGFGEPTLQLANDAPSDNNASIGSAQTQDDVDSSESLDLSVDVGEEALLPGDGILGAQDTNESIELSDEGFDDDAEVTRGDVEGAIALGSTPSSRPEITNEASDPDETALLSDKTPDAGANSESVRDQAQRAFDLAMADLKAGRAGRARSFARVAQKLVPSSALYAAVIDHWSQVTARASAGFADPLPDEMRLFIEAQEQDAQKNVDEAIALVEQAIATAPDNPQLHNYLGVLFAGRLQDAERALKPLMKAVELAPQHAGFRENLTRVLAMGQTESAKVPLPKTQRLTDPKSASS